MVTDVGDGGSSLANGVVMIDPSDAMQGIEDQIAELQTRIVALEQTSAQPVDLVTIEQRLTVIEQQLAGMKVVELDLVLDAIRQAVNGFIGVAP